MRLSRRLPFDVGFPMNMLFEMGGQKYNTRMSLKDIALLSTASNLDIVQRGKPSKAHDSKELADGST